MVNVKKKKDKVDDLIKIVNENMYGFQTEK